MTSKPSTKRKQRSDRRIAKPRKRAADPKLQNEGRSKTGEDDTDTTEDDRLLEMTCREARDAGRKQSRSRGGVLLGIGAVAVCLSAALPDSGGGWFAPFSAVFRAAAAGAPSTTTTTTTTMPVSEQGAPPEGRATLDAGWELLETYAHDPSSFTQGLEVHRAAPKAGEGSCEAEGGANTCAPASFSSSSGEGSSGEDGDRWLVTESTGMYGDSLVRTWDLASGEVVRETKMEDRFFGEGSTRYTDDDGRELLAVLTYKEQSIVVYDANTLERVETLSPWPSPTTTTEGWGIAFDPLERIFVVTDGSAMLHFWDLGFEAIPSRPPIPVRLEELVDERDRVLVARKPAEARGEDGGETAEEEAVEGTLLGHINELEWDPHTRTLLANKWFEDVVLRIDPSNGLVTRVYDFTRLRPRQNRSRGEDVFNGIAILPSTEGKEWLVTGKYWPEVYRIRIAE